jgi:multisubunit Na+/H+ antiporter MnhF subunit
MLSESPLLLAASEAAAPAASPTQLLWLLRLLVIGGFGVLGLAMGFCLDRLVRGPHLADRVLAVDTLGVMLIGLIALLTIHFRTPWFIAAILVLSLLGFAGTVAMAQYIARRTEADRRDRTRRRLPPPPASAASGSGAGIRSGFEVNSGFEVKGDRP